jgi:uncharacterized damage-inducible protein DinB
MESAYKLSPTSSPPSDKSASNLIAANVQAIKQGVELIEKLDDYLYTQANHALSFSGVGGHFRHCIDFYHSFLTGLDSGRINYDYRERDERIEKSRLFATTKLRFIAEGLSRLPAKGHQREIEVLLESSSNPPNGIVDSGWSRSSVKRELQFLLSHTIHHYSLIALALRVLGFEPGLEFGVAPSTLKYWRKTH